MRKHNGRRPVNKSDGPKKIGKRALTKSRRNDEKAIIEEEKHDFSCDLCGQVWSYSKLDLSFAESDGHCHECAV